MIIIDKIIHPKSIDDYEQKIPKKIFQTWETNELHEEMYNSIMTIINLNPEYEYHFFDGNDRRKFIEDNFDEDILRAYDNFIPGAYKADLWRYCVLYKSGGVYLDCKQVHFEPLKEIIKNDIDFAICRDRPVGFLYNAFIASTPGNKLLNYLINECVVNSRNNYYGLNPLSITGPHMVGSLFNKLLGRNDREPYLLETYDIDGIRVDVPIEYETEGEKNVKDRSGKLVFETRYDGYYNQTYGDIVSKYHRLWHENGVYQNEKK